MKNILFILLMFIQLVSFGQDFGPHTFNLVPKNITSVSLYYINSHNNITPSNDVVLQNGIVDVDAFVTPIVHTFSIAGHLSQVFITPGAGRIGGFVDINDHQSEIVKVNGLIDANVMMRIGILNTPALDMENFAKRELKFQLSGIISINAPVGQYSETRRVNLGGNRWAFKLGIPMIIPLNKNKAKILQWEIVPSFTFFTPNSELFAGGVKTQDPLLYLEQHLSKNFTKRFWASINVDYQYGGKRFIDGTSSGNVINQLGAGVTASYAPFTNFPLTFHANYSRTWFNSIAGYLFQLGASMAIPSKTDKQYLKSINEKE